MPIYTVKPGDCLASIARELGFHRDTLWNHDANRELRRRRTDPYVLQPGDRLFVPEKEIREELCDTDACHEFELCSGHNVLNLKVLDVDTVRANQRCVVIIDGDSHVTATDERGIVTFKVPDNARSGRLVVGADQQALMDVELRFGHLDPMEEASGSRRRLANLGFLPAGDSDGDQAQALNFGVQAFQRKFGLEPTGELDDRTSTRLRSEHGS